MSDALVQVSNVHKVYTRGSERVVVNGLEILPPADPLPDQNTL